MGHTEREREGRDDKRGRGKILLGQVFHMWNAVNLVLFPAPTIEGTKAEVPASRGASKGPLSIYVLSLSRRAVNQHFGFSY